MEPRTIIAFIVCACFGASILNIHGVEAGAVEFVNSDLQLGALTNGQIVSVTFMLTNSSDKAVKIANVDASCRCTSVQKSPGEISAHGSGAVELNFDSSRSDGHVTQSVLVETTDGQIITGQFSASVGALAAAASIAPWIPDRGDGTYQNPVLFAD